MKPLRLVLLGIGMVLVLSGCGALFSGLLGGALGTDLGIMDMNVYDVGTSGPIDQVQFMVGNSGATARNAEYIIVLSADDNVDPDSDFVVYKDTFTLPFNQAKTFSVYRDDMDAYVSDNSVAVTVGSYYFVGVILDPDDELGDTYPSDNIEVSFVDYEW